jgi:uncharacterized protein (DUF362 family)
MSREEVTRRDFLRRALGATLAACGLSGMAGLRSPESVEAAAPSGPTIAAAAGKEPAGGLRPAGLVRAAVEALGGMGRFVRQGARVLVKPNIAWARKPEQAATTNPEVVAEIVRLCKSAGAREVKVVDHALDRPDALVLRMTGIREAAEKAGATVSLASSAALYERVNLRRGKALRSADVLRDLRRADVFINVPIAKVHGTTGLTLGCKNLMGTVWDRGAWHGSASLDQAIADYAAEIRPHLVILDAVRILLTNGPTGPGRTEDRGMVVAGTDPLAVDAYGATLFGRQPRDVGHLARAYEMGVGEINLDRIRIKYV